MTVNIFIPDSRKAIIRSSLTFLRKRLKLDEKNNHILQIRNGGFLKCLEQRRTVICKVTKNYR